jgi:ribonuclease HI
MGVIYDPKGTERIYFAWGLGHATNNQAEAMKLYVGLNLISFEQYREVIVINNSELIIKIVRKQIEHKQHNLVRAFQRIIKEEKMFKKVEHFHVLGKMNQREDLLAKEACDLGQGILKQNQVFSNSFLPYNLRFKFKKIKLGSIPLSTYIILNLSKHHIMTRHHFSMHQIAWQLD